MLDQAASKCIETIQYFDGLGRSFMTVQKGVTPSRKNLLTEQWRDETGRLVEDRLPIVTTSDRVYSYKEAIISEIAESSLQNSCFPSKTVIFNLSF